MEKYYRISVRSTRQSLGLIEGMSIEVPMLRTESPRHGSGYEKVRRMFMTQYGVDIDVKQAWAPIYPSFFIIEEIG